MNELKRCPFCKGEMTTTLYLSRLCLACKVCGCVFIPGWPMRKEEIIRFWNGRAEQ